MHLIYTGVIVDFAQVFDQYAQTVAIVFGQLGNQSRQFFQPISDILGVYNRE
jgi:hypothetical protein